MTQYRWQVRPGCCTSAMVSQSDLKIRWFFAFDSGPPKQIVVEGGQGLGEQCAWRSASCSWKRVDGAELPRLVCPLLLSVKDGMAFFVTGKHQD